jgi:hypothetical protein
MQFANASIGVLRAETHLLASVAECPRQSFGILREAGITIDSFANIDTAAIFVAIEQASDSRSGVKPWTLSDKIDESIRLLRGVACWDDVDFRRFITHSLRWGPGPLCALLCRVPFSPQTIRAAVDDLHNANEVLARLARKAAA